jgi:hypothetical protein
VVKIVNLLQERSEFRPAGHSVSYETRRIYTIADISLRPPLNRAHYYPFLFLDLICLGYPLPKLWFNSSLFCHFLSLHSPAVKHVLFGDLRWVNWSVLKYSS